MNRLTDSTLRNPTNVALLTLAKVSQTACRTTAVRKAPPTRQSGIACPLSSLSRHRTAHTSPIQAICPAGEVSPRTSSTSSSTPRSRRTAGHVEGEEMGGYAQSRHAAARAFMARLTSTARITSESKACTIISTFALRLRTAVSVGLKAVLVLNARNR
jgi:hypothetical protein